MNDDQAYTVRGPRAYTVHLVDGERSFAVPTRGGDISLNYDDRTVCIPVNLEALRGMLGAGHPSEAEGEQERYPDDIRGLIGDPHAHQQDPDDIPEDLVRQIYRDLEAEQDHPVVAWWLADAREVAEATVPKAIEYGSIELVEAGRTLARLMGRDEVSDQEAMETQIYQYVMGKMGRWTAAMGRGERVSDDTVFDILVYATMVRKIRQTGEWP